MRTIRKNCLNCGVEFDAPIKEVNRGFGKCCSRKCSGQYVATLNRKEKKPNVTCANCGEKFYKPEHKLSGSKSGLYFCTRACKDDAQRIGGVAEIMPPHYGTGKVKYRQKLLDSIPPNDLKCNRCGYSEVPEILSEVQ